MDNIILQKTWVQGCPVIVDNLLGTAFTGEAQAHTFVVSGVDAAQEPVTITGTITGKFLAANNVTVPLTGSLVNGAASVTLTDECYDVPGRYILSIYATNGSTTQCLYCAVGNVFRTDSQTIAYPSTDLPNITTLMAQLEEILDGWPADYSQLQNDVSSLKSAIDHDLGSFAVYGKYTATKTLFTIDQVTVGDVITYKYDAQGPVAYIETLDSNGTRIAYYGKGSSSQPVGVYQGKFTIPSNFASARMVLNNGGYYTIIDLYKNDSMMVRLNDVESDTNAIKNYVGMVVPEGTVTNGQILFTSDDVPVGTTLAYKITAIAPISYIRLLDSSGNAITGYVYGKTSSSAQTLVYSGTFTLPSGYAKCEAHAEGGTTFTVNYIDYANGIKHDLAAFETATNASLTAIDDRLLDDEQYIYYKQHFTLNAVLTNAQITAGALLQYTLIGDAQLGYIEFLDSNSTRISVYGKTSSGTPVGTVYTGTLEVPATFATMKVSGNGGMTLTLSKLTLKRQLSIMSGDRITVKERTELMDKNQYYYAAFSSGVNFAGMEIHATRLGANHYPTDAQTAIQFLIVDEKGNMRTVYPAIDYTTLEETDLRDPNLSVTPDGQYMIMSVFGEVKNGNTYEVTKSYLFIFNTSLEIVKTVDIGVDGWAAWGNTLITPDGHVLKALYKNTDTRLYISNETFNTTSLTFTLKKELAASETGANIVEPTIGYVGDKLVFLARTTDLASSVLFTTSDLEGGGTWSAMKQIGYAVHSPVMPLKTEGNVFRFGGSLWLGNYQRPPCVGVYDISNDKCVVKNIDPSITVSGGYPSMVNIGGDTYAMLYYEDFNNTAQYTFLYYRRVNIRRVLSAPYNGV